MKIVAASLQIDPCDKWKEPFSVDDKRKACLLNSVKNCFCSSSSAGANDLSDCVNLLKVSENPIVVSVPLQFHILFVLKIRILKMACSSELVMVLTKCVCTRYLASQ